MRMIFISMRGSEYSSTQHLMIHKSAILDKNMLRRLDCRGVRSRPIRFKFSGKPLFIPRSSKTFSSFLREITTIHTHMSILTPTLKIQMTVMHTLLITTPTIAQTRSSASTLAARSCTSIAPNSSTRSAP